MSFECSARSAKIVRERDELIKTLNDQLLSNSEDVQGMPQLPEGALDVKATLIIMPKTLQKQWMDAIAAWVISTS